VVSRPPHDRAARRGRRANTGKPRFCWLDNTSRFVLPFIEDAREIGVATHWVRTRMKVHSYGASHQPEQCVEEPRRELLIRTDIGSVTLLAAFAHRSSGFERLAAPPSEHERVKSQ
jgi:hypothetical protein